jgi:hypothetical protein
MKGTIIVMNLVNFIRARGLNNTQFISPLRELCDEHLIVLHLTPVLDCWAYAKFIRKCGT